MSCWQFIEQEQRVYFVDLLCRTLDVSPARYYAWRKQRQAAPTPPARDWQEAMKQAFSDHRRCYGTRQLRAELRAQGYRVGRQRLRTGMQHHGLRALQPRASTPRTTASTYGLRCAPNRLLDQPKPTQANQVWVSDITYLPLASG
jgi:transposase InsO family protein